LSFINAYYSSIDIYTVGGKISCPRVTECEVRKPITDGIFSCDIVFDYNSLTSKENPPDTIVDIGNTIDVHICQEGRDPYLCFSGKIVTIEKTIEGQQPRDVRIQANGWGDALVGTYFGYVKYQEIASDLIEHLVQPLIDQDILTDCYVDYDSRTITWDHLGDQVQLWEGVKEVCNKIDFDFWVDNNKILYARRRGDRTGTVNLTDKITKIDYILDGSKIINSQRVIGGTGNSIGSDDEYTESTDLWTSNGSLDVYTEVVLDYGEVTVPDPKYGAGDYAVRSVISNASTTTPWARITFPEPLDLSFFGVLCFALYWGVDTTLNPLTSPSGTVIGVRFETTSNDWIEYIKELSGIKIQNLFPLYSKYLCGWYSVELGFNVRAKGDKVITSGRPRWSEINSIKFIIYGPLSTSPLYHEGRLMIDNMYFADGYYYYFLEDSDSINVFGERRGKLLYMPELSSTEECYDVAEQIIGYFSQPIKEVKSIQSLDIIDDFELGYQYTISLEDISEVECILKEIDYSIRDQKLVVTYNLSEVRTKDLYDLLSDLKKTVDELDQEAIPDNLLSSALVPYQTGPLGPKDVDLSQTGRNLVPNFSFEIDSNGDLIPDRWYPSDPSMIYMSVDERVLGQYSAWLRDDLTLESDYFQIDIEWGYHSWFFAKCAHGTEVGTLSVDLIFYDYAPYVNPLGTINICENVSPSTWTYYYKTIYSNDVPNNARWAKIRLSAKGGEAIYVDDVCVQRLEGIDVGPLMSEKYVILDTNQTDWETVWWDYWEPKFENTKLIVTHVGCDLMSGSGDHVASTRVIIKSNEVPVSTIEWSTLEMSWQHFKWDGEVDACGFKDMLSVEFQLKTEYGGVAYIKCPQVWMNVYSLDKKLLNPFTGEPL